LIAEGYASKQISGLLSLTKKTVEKHRQTLMGKVDRHNIATLARYAVATGVMELNAPPTIPQLAAHRFAVRQVVKWT
jgi:hypothetical protein